METKSSSRKRRAHELLARLALLLAGPAVIFLLFEAVFRVIVPASPPGTTYGKAVHRNSLGLRDRDFAIPKPESTYRIVMLGDSFAWGVGLPVEQALPKLLEAELSAEHTGLETEVVNAAKPGYNTVEELLLLQELGMSYEPDMVILVYNLNDIEFLPQLAEGVYREEPTPVVEIDPGEDITQYSRNAGLRGFVLKIERRSLFVRFLVPRVGVVLRKAGLIDSVEFSWVEKIYQGFTDSNPGWLESKRAIREIAGLCRKEGCELLVAIYPLFADLENYQGRAAHETIARFCNDEGIPAVDLLPVFEHTRASSHWINFMDSHPNAAAHRAVAEALLPYVLERLRRRQPSASVE